MSENQVIVVLLLCIFAEALAMRHFWLKSERLEKKLKERANHDTVAP